MRFRKSIRIAPGVRLNLSRSGISTTLGGRGASVNIGKRGTRATVGIPGTGISWSTRVGGGGASNHGATQAGGCAGVGCLGFVLLVLLGMCIDADGPQPSPDPVTPALYTEPVTSETREWFYIHGSLNVRAAPRKDAALVRTLRRGDFVQLGPRDANGWARLYSAGSADGYVYRASGLVQRQAPATRSAESSSRGVSSSTGGSRRSSASSRGYYTGPRGGCYTYSASGRKRYVDRSYCN
ncbi:MAG TPA: DUF4236 domain-containing protein [Longimicrobium sp.]|nr:DUF4236 domain-containing protein [Longimicrobium sp.]